MKRLATIVAITVLIGTCSFAALYAGIQVGYGLAAADGRMSAATK